MSALATLAQATVNYSTSSNLTGAEAASVGGFLAFFAAFAVIFIAIALAGYIFGAIVLGKLFKKAGMKEVWPAWVPIYNAWKLLGILGYPGWLIFVPFVVSIIPVINMLSGLVGIAFSIFLAIAAGRAFGKKDDIGWIVLLTLVPIVGYPILAFGSAKYTKPTEKDLLFKI